MPVHSKWQSLPTEAINPDTLAFDKLAASDIVEHMLHEDRKMLAAVQREKERIAVGIDILTSALRHNGRIVFVGAANTVGEDGQSSGTQHPQHHRRRGSTRVERLDVLLRLVAAKRLRARLVAADHDGRYEPSGAAVQRR